jgi:hypothetical protein
MRRLSLTVIVLTGVACAAAVSAQAPDNPDGKVSETAREHETEEVTLNWPGMVYGPLRDDRSRDITVRKDAVGKRVIVEGIAWGQPFGLKGQEGTISPWAGPHVVHQEGSVFVKGVDFTETRARGKPVRVTGTLRLQPGVHSHKKFGRLRPYFYIEATAFEPLEAVADPYIVLAKE